MEPRFVGPLIILAICAALIYVNLYVDSNAQQPLVRIKFRSPSESSSPSSNVSSSLSSSSSSSGICETALAIAIIPALPLHPSCVAAHTLVSPLWICYKHGGHIPGCSRSGIGPNAPLPALLKSRMCQDGDEVDTDRIEVEARIAIDDPDARPWFRSFNRGELSAKNPNVLTIGAAAAAKKKPASSSSSSLAAAAAASANDAKTTQLVLRHVIVINGKIYTPAVLRNVQVSGIYSMISNNWPQTLTRRLPTFGLDDLPESFRAKNPRAIAWACRSAVARAMNKVCAAAAVPDLLDSSSSTHLEWGYWQAPTDFLSSYHVTVEVTLTMFHAVFRSAAQRHRMTPIRFWNEVVVPAYANASSSSSSGRKISLPNARTAAAAAAVTSRPTSAMFGFKKKSCREGAATCLDTVWAAMYATLFSFLAPFVAGNSTAASSQQQQQQQQPVLHSTSEQRGKSVILGLDDEEGTSARLFEMLHIGYPTHCEPLWGRDPLVIHDAAATQQQQNVFDRLTKSAVRECDLLLWAMRSAMLLAAAQALPALAAATPIDFATAPPKVLWASRKGDWARDVVNEDEFLAALDSHIHKAFCSSSSSSSSANNAACTRCTPSSSQKLCHINSVRFSGKLESQIAKVAFDGATTIFIAPHGANILPSVFLPPNAAVITLDAERPGFYPYGTFPSWLHWRRLVVDRRCNMRLEANRAKGKCKVRSPNNDDLVVTKAQIAQILAFVDELVKLQREQTTKKRAPFASFV